MIDLIPDRYKLLAGGIALAGALACAGFVGWQIKGMQADAEIANLQAGYAREKAQQATAALVSLKADADAVRQAATEYMSVQAGMHKRMAAISSELIRAQQKKPLPMGCIPDDARFDALKSAVSAAKSATENEAIH